MELQLGAADHLHQVQEQYHRAKELAKEEHVRDGAVPDLFRHEQDTRKATKE